MRLLANERPDGYGWVVGKVGGDRCHLPAVSGGVVLTTQPRAPGDSLGEPSTIPLSEVFDARGEI